MKTAALILFLAGLAAPVLCCAGEMPVLPDLPPLPASYVPAGAGGSYVGVLGGLTDDGGSHAGGLGLIVGHTLAGNGVMFGAEAQAFSTYRDTSIDFSLRLGLPVSPVVLVFAQAGLGTNFRAGPYATAGVSADLEINPSASLRLQYTWERDFDSEASRRKALTGLMVHF